MVSASTSVCVGAHLGLRIAPRAPSVFLSRPRSVRDDRVRLTWRKSLSSTADKFRLVSSLCAVAWRLMPDVCVPAPCMVSVRLRVRSRLEAQVSILFLFIFIEMNWNIKDKLSKQAYFRTCQYAKMYSCRV